MVHLIVGLIGVVLIIMSIIAGIIAANDKEDKYPRWLSINWPFIFMMYMVIIGLCYFVYLFYPYLVMFSQYLKDIKI